MSALPQRKIIRLPQLGKTRRDERTSGMALKVRGHLSLLQGYADIMEGVSPQLRAIILPWLALAQARIERLARRAAFSPSANSGQPGSDQRRRYVARFAVHLTRTLADASGTHLAVRGRPGPAPGQIVVAYPWRRRGAAEAFARELAPLLTVGLDGRRSVDRAIEAAAQSLEHVSPGAAPTTLSPTIPVIAVTGTNGKTTTLRLIAHLARTAGHTVAYTTTDGVYRDQALV